MAKVAAKRAKKLTDKPVCDVMCVSPVEVKGSKGHPLDVVKIELPQHDADLVLVLPNHEKIELQFRAEYPSLDVCLPSEMVVTGWLGEGMLPAPIYAKLNKGGRPHIRLATQLCVSLSPDSFRDTADQEEAGPKGD